VPISNVPAELWVGEQLVGSGVCHLIRRNGDEGGTLSGIIWSGSEPELTGRPVRLMLTGGRQLQVTVLRQSHPEGRTIIRFAVRTPAAGDPSP
jgi:hypothetical protein